MVTYMTLLDIVDLKENSILDLNIDDKTLESSIVDAQNIDLQGILGTKLYMKIVDISYDESISGETNSEYKTLMDDYIFPVLLKASLLRCVLPMRVQFRNKGIVQLNSENSQSVDKEYINYIENKFRNDLEFYSNKLKGYLCYFFNKYPEYDETLPANRLDYNKPNKKNAYFCGINL